MRVEIYESLNTLFLDKGGICVFRVLHKSAPLKKMLDYKEEMMKKKMIAVLVMIACATMLFNACAVQRPTPQAQNNLLQLEQKT
jgi:hypothetical protein